MQRLVVDYVVFYPGAKGKVRPKVFKLKKVELSAGGRVALSDAFRPSISPRANTIQASIASICQ